MYFRVESAARGKNVAGWVREQCLIVLDNSNGLREVPKDKSTKNITMDLLCVEFSVAWHSKRASRLNLPAPSVLSSLLLSPSRALFLLLFPPENGC
ncbi:Hypothetical predicted protein [Cloeon dipterum]|uniref:Uncharacterized protein n=1 Tax=Cloeon dipterum TaxID=197152 RepID=A0A8S1C6B6_9INSE|nr:Hypothetical predicted protein [Cloeon dipterum]